uniref:LOB domain-containing protein 18 n=1 Tax=Cajanus cajan TaxID=3821 RepID=A0A151TBP8_CAJCA|nr:LOB domain-containing protein 18 [Cajanus cajan]
MSINSSCSGGNNSNNNNGGGNSSGGSPCGACKFLRRKCVPGCIFAPYFDSEQGATHFAAVHKVFGASNVSKLLLNIPVHKRLDAVVTICYEAQARLRDPVYGCVAHIFALQQQVIHNNRLINWWVNWLMIC